MCSQSSLSRWCILIGCVMCLVSIAGIGLSLFLIFDDPFYDSQLVQGTYEPSWEDVGPAMVLTVVSLLVNVLLVGGAKQGSKDMLLTWTIWKVAVVSIFWLWYGYNQLKFHGYIDWRDRGMKNCYFCGDQYTEQYVVMGGAIGSLTIVFFMIPVEMLRSKLKTTHREMTELMPTGSVQYLDGQHGGPQHSSQLIQAHPNFYPIQPTWHHQQGGGGVGSHTQQYLLQQQYEMQQNYNMMQHHQQQQQLPPGYKPTAPQNYYY